jgi:hypothetical protein
MASVYDSQKVSGNAIFDSQSISGLSTLSCIAVSGLAFASSPILQTTLSSNGIGAASFNGSSLSTISSFLFQGVSASSFLSHASIPIAVWTNVTTNSNIWTIEGSATNIWTNV